jgi:hypothetical protein
MKLNIIKEIEKVNAETITYKETHPYFGLKDERGWLTRYPREELVITREDMVVFLNAGGKLDSQGTWGVNPYEGFQGLSPEKAAEFQQAAHHQRWDNVPTRYNNLITVSDTCNFSDYLLLHCGAEMLHELNRHGIETNASLFTLARKVKCHQHASESKWLHRKIAANFDFNNSADMEWAKYSVEILHHLAPYGNKYFIKRVSDYKKFKRRQELNCHSEGSINIVSDKLSKWCLKNIQWRDYYKSLSGIYWDFKSHHTSIGKVCLGRKFFHCNYGGQIFSARVKTIGKFSAVLLLNRYFVWVTSEGFGSHVESISLKGGVRILQLKLSKREERKDILERGIVSFRTFRKMTSSCLEGTKSWLLDKKYFHFWNLLYDFNTWEEVFTSEIADIKFQMTPEFMESIKFRF